MLNLHITRIKRLQSACLHLPKNFHNGQQKDIITVRGAKLMSGVLRIMEINKFQLIQEHSMCRLFAFCSDLALPVEIKSFCAPLLLEILFCTSN